MRKEVKEAAEMYALGAINFEQMLEVCDTYFEIGWADEYAENYGQRYNQWLRDKEEWEAQNSIESSFINSIDERCYYEILYWGFQEEFIWSGELSPFQFCLEFDIVPDDILDRYIDDCCIIED